MVKTIILSHNLDPKPNWCQHFSENLVIVPFDPILVAITKLSMESSWSRAVSNL